jgi:hypothetical protein
VGIISKTAKEGAVLTNAKAELARQLQKHCQFENADLAEHVRAAALKHAEGVNAESVEHQLFLLLSLGWTQKDVLALKSTPQVKEG